MKHTKIELPCAPKSTNANAKWEVQNCAQCCLDKNITDEYFVCLEKIGEKL